MDLSLEQRVFYGENISKIKRNEDCAVYKMKDKTGEGTMSCYSVFPGIDLLYNDFHMQSCFSEFQPKVEMIAIDHCMEGRIEWEFENGTYMYLQKGDMQIDNKENHNNRYGFPLNRYQGITVAIYIEEAAKSLSVLFDGISIDIFELHNKFSLSKMPLIMRADNSVQHIFTQLYTVSHRIRKDYYKIKVLELLLFLSAVDIPKISEGRPYFQRKHVETVKEIEKYITKHKENHFTLEELSCQFEIPLTTMKNCFKGIYGTSIYAYIRSHRIQTAAAMLHQSNENITTIAGRVGYNNPSKFAAAFKEIMGISPSKYKK
ncbi:MAG: AraC family transcriptional regulator [Thermotaleaceae bacterium]